LTEVRVALNKFGRRLWTRDKAREVRQVVEDRLEKMPAIATLVIDGTGVEVFDFSFANELFGRLALALPTLSPPRFVVVEHLEPYARENLEKAMMILNLAIIERRGGRTQLLGKVGTADAETFAVLSSSKRPVTAVQLADKLQTALTAMSERLTRLMKLGVVARVRAEEPTGREQYAYVAPR
jgi:hypothetical protein